MKNVRVGVIGAGTMGERHCRVYSSLRYADFVGLADLNVERGQAIASDYGTDYFEDYRQLLSKVDAVTIATTTPAHFKLAMEALEQNVHVLVEKPITETLDQGRQLVAKSKEKDLILQVGHIERFNRAYTQLKHVIDGKRLVAINVRRLSSFDASNTDVDVIRDLMIHDLDLIGNLLGQQFESMHAWGRSISTDAIDHAEAIFSYKDGPIVSLVASRITEQKVRSIEAIAEGAYIEADLLGKSLMIHRRTFPQFINQAGTYRQESVMERIHVPMEEPLMLELRHFLECVGKDIPSNVPGQDGLYALELADQITQQIKNRNSLELSNISNGQNVASPEVNSLKM